MLRLVDVSRYQVEIPNPLDLGKAQAAGYHIANVALTGGQGYASGPWARTYADRARALGMGLSTYHWLDGRTPGGRQAADTILRIRQHLGPASQGFAHIVDVEETGKHGITPPTRAHVRDYVDAIQQAFGRHMAVYTGDHWWKPRGWDVSDLTPYVHAAPNVGYQAVYPGDTSPMWAAGYGGWDSLAIMQWGVAPLPGTSDCSLSAIRDHGVWADLTGGDVLMPTADPGNAQPDAWAGATAPAALINDLDTFARDMAHRMAPRTGNDDVADMVRWLQRREYDVPYDLLTLMPRGAGEVCSPVIGAEMADWLALGGKSSGCVGDAKHGTGFHRGASGIPASDYSRRRDPNGGDGPFVNWSWACAGDFSHGGNPELRKLHKAVLALLRAGAFPMICEMIVQPDAGKPVMYWARWEGVSNLREYTGSGHDTWSHISWYRSRADERPHLWKAVDMALTDAEIDRIFNKDNVLTNRPWRGDVAANPKVAGATGIVGTWDEAHGAKLAAEAARALGEQNKVTLAALLTAVKGADDSAEITAAITKAVSDLRADYTKQIADIKTATAERDAANLRQVLDRLGAIEQGGITPAMLRDVLRSVYGEAFTRADGPAAG